MVIDEGTLLTVFAALPGYRKPLTQFIEEMQALAKDDPNGDLFVHADIGPHDELDPFSVSRLLKGYAP